MKAQCNIFAVGSAMDDEGSLYVSDTESDEARRYGGRDGREENSMAGRHGEGTALNQLNRSRQIFADVVMAGGRGEGTGWTQLPCPRGIFVNQGKLNSRRWKWSRVRKESVPSTCTCFIGRPRKSLRRRSKSSMTVPPKAEPKISV